MIYARSIMYRAAKSQKAGEKQSVRRRSKANRKDPGEGVPGGSIRFLSTTVSILGTWSAHARTQGCVRGRVGSARNGGP